MSRLAELQEMQAAWRDKKLASIPGTTRYTKAMGDRAARAGHSIIRLGMQFHAAARDDERYGDAVAVISLSADTLVTLRGYIDSARFFRAPSRYILARDELAYHLDRKQIRAKFFPNATKTGHDQLLQEKLKEIRKFYPSDVQSLSDEDFLTHVKSKLEQYHQAHNRRLEKFTNFGW